MPKVLWKRYMEDPDEFRKMIDRELGDKFKGERIKGERERREIRFSRERKLRFEARKHAKRCIEDLVFIVCNMHNVSRTPEKEFARIFTDDNSDALSRIGKARIDGLFGLPLIEYGQVWDLSCALQNIGIESDFLKLQRDKKYRTEMHHKLLATPKYSFLRNLSLELEKNTSIREVGKIDIRVPNGA